MGGGEARWTEDRSRGWKDGGDGTEGGRGGVEGNDIGTGDECIRRTSQVMHGTNKHARSLHNTTARSHASSDYLDHHSTSRHTTMSCSVHRAPVAPVLVLVRRGATHRDDLPVPTGWRSWGRCCSGVPRCIGPGATPGPVLGECVPSCATGDGTHGGCRMRACDGGRNGGMGWRTGKSEHHRRDGGIDMRRTEHCPTSSLCQSCRPRSIAITRTRINHPCTRNPQAVYRHAREGTSAPQHSRHHVCPNTIGDLRG
jgi:hypothetical protein